MADGEYIENKARFGWLSPDRLNQVRLPLYRTLGRALRRTAPPRRVLILSHMRAGSTLLSAAAEVSGDVERELAGEQGRWADKSRGEAVGLVTRSADSLLKVAASLTKLADKLSRNVTGLHRPDAYKAARERGVTICRNTGGSNCDR